MFELLKTALYGLGLGRAYGNAVKVFIDLTEAGFVPDFVLRRAMRFLIGSRAAQAPKDPEARLQQTLGFVEELKGLPIAINTAEANEQHYEVRDAFSGACSVADPTWAQLGIWTDGTGGACANAHAGHDDMTRAVV